MLGSSLESGGKKGEDVLDSRILAFASKLVEIALNVFIKQHIFLFKDTESLGEPVLSHLNKVNSICRDLAYSVELIEQDKIMFDRNLQYLFKWDNLTTKGIIRVTNYIKEEMRIPIDDIAVEVVNKKLIKLIVFTSEDTFPPDLGGIRIRDKETAELTLEIGHSKHSAILDIREHNGNRYVFGRKIKRIRN